MDVSDNEDPESPLPVGQGIELPSDGLIGVYALRDARQRVVRSLYSDLQFCEYVPSRTIPKKLLIYERRSPLQPSFGHVQATLYIVLIREKPCSARPTYKIPQLPVSLFHRMSEAAFPGEMELARPRRDSHPKPVKEPLKDPSRPMELSVSLARLLVHNPLCELTLTAIVDDEKPGRSPKKL